ncbi:MAG: class I SAM-dependent methyltransferase [Cytophagales bacterium]|nr:class I SAM-dependent methyltransferase [Cytophagales bacterium]
MIRRIKRSDKFEISLVVKDDQFIRPPKDAQRNALLNRAIKEFAEDLTALDHQAGKFVQGAVQNTFIDRTQAILDDQEIMEDWQVPVMQAMAGIVTESQGDILEIGFGRGISSDMIQSHRVRSHTIIECNDAIVARFYQWKGNYQDRDIRLVHGLWQDVMDGLGCFDGIFFHTYPLNEDEYMNYVNGSVTFAAHFFETAEKHLRPEGVFTYFSNEIDSLGREHQRLILKHFSSFSAEIVELNVPDDVKDTWWANSMVVIKAVK